MSPRRLVVSVTFCGTVVLAIWTAAGVLGFGLPRIGNTAVATEGSRTTSASAGAEPIDAARVIGTGGNGASFTDVVIIGAALPDPGPVPQRETPPMQLASISMPDPVQGHAKEVLKSGGIPNECHVVEICTDQYLWLIYQRTTKVDTIKVPERIKVIVKEGGKTRTVIKTVVKLVDEDFTWKDPKAAEQAGMSLEDYVIGGMDRSFKLKLYRALRAMENAGLSPGMTSGFRDDTGNQLQAATRLRLTAHTMGEAVAAAMATGLRPIS